MVTTTELLLQARVDTATLEAWMAEGWILRREGDAFAEFDLARARLIRDLREELGVNEAGVAVALDLLDQLHGLRGALRELAGVLGALPEPARSQALATLRGVGGA